MRATGTNTQLPRPRRNYSDFEPKLSYLKNLQEIIEQQKTIRSKLTSIKINRHKLPADFFPRSETVRKKVSSTRPSLENGISIPRQSKMFELSQQNIMSPEKTSFFGFIQPQKDTKIEHANTLSLKRQFESRNEPKRQKIYFEHRNFTPSTGAHRNDILLVYSDNYNKSISDVLKLQKKKKRQQLGAKESQIKTIGKLMEGQQLEPQSRAENGKEMNISTSGGSEDMHNITFYNAKSTSFPPINKNHNS